MSIITNPLLRASVNSGQDFWLQVICTLLTICSVIAQPAVRAAGPSSRETVSLSASEYLRRGNQKCERKDYKAALVEYDEAMRLAPKSAEVYYRRANTRANLDDYEKALADFDQAVSLMKVGQAPLQLSGDWEFAYQDGETVVAGMMSIKQDGERLVGTGRDKDTFRIDGKYKMPAVTFTKEYLDSKEQPKGKQEFNSAACETVCGTPYMQGTYQRGDANDQWEGLMLRDTDGQSVTSCSELLQRLEHYAQQLKKEGRSSLAAQFEARADYLRIGSEGHFQLRNPDEP